MRQLIPIFLFACLFGYFGESIHFPLPWTLGPLAATVIWILSFKETVPCPKWMRNTGLLVLGYVMGSPFTPEIGLRIVSQLPFMLLTSLTTVALCLLVGHISGRYSGVGVANSLIGSIPGGLSQMSSICEETPGTSAAIVTLMQTVRVVTVVFVIPFITLHGLSNGYHDVTRPITPFLFSDLNRLFPFAVVIACFTWVFKRFKVPTPLLLGPVLGTAALVLSGANAPVLPPKLVAFAQVLIGIRMGAEACATRVANWRQIVWINFLSVTAVIAGLLAISCFLSQSANITLATAFISMSPGGVSEMGLTAMMIDADLPTVVSFQLFRMLFALIVAIPAVRWYVKKTTEIGLDC